jgi:threonine/homoserine/homoserine lactone efflux protein
MTLHTWWLFVLMTFVVSATPGPNMLLVMTVSARSGLRAAIVTMLGCMTALLAMMCISAAGLGAVLQTFPAVFDLLKLAGAAYLAYLGVKSWQAPVSESAGGEAVVCIAQEKTGAIYRQGFLVAASNPKALLFAAAFLPQFIDPEAPKLTQFSILLFTFSVIEVSWYFVYALSGKSLSHYLQRASVMKAFNRITGGVFVAFASWMAMARE